MKRYIIVAALMAALLPTAAYAQDTEVKNYEFRLGWCGYPTMDYEDFVVNSSNYYHNTSIEDMFSDIGECGMGGIFGNAQMGIDLEEALVHGLPEGRTMGAAIGPFVLPAEGKADGTASLPDLLLGIERQRRIGLM